jgi:hypothetical protein
MQPLTLHAACHGMQLGAVHASTLLRANHPWLLSASYAVPCQACSSLALSLSRGQQRPKLYILYTGEVCLIFELARGFEKVTKPLVIIYVRDGMHARFSIVSTIG